MYPGSNEGGPSTGSPTPRPTSRA